MRKLIPLAICLLLASLLQGCIVGAVVAGGAAGCAVAADRRCFHTIAEDEKIAYAIDKRISHDKELSGQCHVSGISYNHIVLLVGQTPTPELRAQIEQIAQAQPNVRRVFNEITIEQPTSALTRSKDTAITANVKTRLMTTTNVSARQIKVVTENGVVYLLGITSHDQADIAAQVARNSTGVIKVVKLIEYINV